MTTTITGSGGVSQVQDGRPPRAWFRIERGPPTLPPPRAWFRIERGPPTPPPPRAWFCI